MAEFRKKLFRGAKVEDMIIWLDQQREEARRELDKLESTARELGVTAWQVAPDLIVSLTKARERVETLTDVITFVSREFGY